MGSTIKHECSLLANLLCNSNKITENEQGNFPKKCNNFNNVAFGSMRNRLN